MIHNLVGEAAIAMVIITVQHGLLCQGQGQGEVSEALISGTEFNVVLKFTIETNNTLLQCFKKIKSNAKSNG